MQIIHAEHIELLRYRDLDSPHVLIQHSKCSSHGSVGRGSSPSSASRWVVSALICSHSWKRREKIGIKQTHIYNDYIHPQVRYPTNVWTIPLSRTGSCFLLKWAEITSKWNVRTFSRVKESHKPHLCISKTNFKAVWYCWRCCLSFKCSLSKTISRIRRKG